MGMTDKEILNRIAELVKELNPVEISKEEYLEELKDSCFNNISDELWDFYCFACDVKYALTERAEDENHT